MEHNFGKINAIFLQNADKLIKTAKGKKIIKEYVTKIKESKELMKQYSIFEYIENQHYNDNLKDYIHESINYLSSINKKKLKEENIALSNLLKENDITEKCIVENEDLYNSINTLIFSNSGIKSINERVDNINSIVEHIKKNKPTITEKKENLLSGELTNETLAFVVNKFNNKYFESLDEEQKKIFESITSKNETEIEQLFENNRTECITLTNNFLKESIDNDTREKLLNVKEKLLEQKFNKDTYIDDIIDFIELKETLSE